MNEEEIADMYNKGIVHISTLVEALIDNFKKDKTSVDIQQCQLIIDYLLTEREFDENYIEELEKQLEE